MNKISLKWKMMYCTCRNNSATICQRKVNCDFLFSCLKNDNCSRFQNFNKFVVGQIINNPLPNLHSRGTSIQGTLSSFLWLYPHWKQALLFGWAKRAAWQRASEWFTRKGGFVWYVNYITHFPRNVSLGCLWWQHSWRRIGSWPSRRKTERVGSSWSKT